MKNVRSSRNFRKGIQRRFYETFGCYVEYFTRRFIEVESEGVENVPENGPCLILPKHIRLIDPLVLGVALLQRKAVYPSYLMAPFELRNIPLANRLLEFVGAVPWNRTKEMVEFSNRRGSMRENYASLEHISLDFKYGGHGVVFPEGTIVKEDVGRCHKRIFKWAVKQQEENGEIVSFNPVGLEYHTNGDDKVRKVNIRFGKAHYYNGDINELVEQCQESIRSLSGL